MFFKPQYSSNKIKQRTSNIINDLIDAIVVDNEEKLKCLIESIDSSIINKKSVDGSSLLHIAVQSCSVNCTRMLIKAKADINTVSAYNGDSVLQTAVRSLASSSIIKMLLKGKADVNWFVAGNSPLYMATETKSSKIVNILLKAKADPNWYKMHIFSKTADDLVNEEEEDMVEDDSIDNTMMDGKTALYLAVSQSSCKLTEMLLNSKADPNISNTLSMAKTSEIESLLIKHGAIKHPFPILDYCRSGDSWNLWAELAKTNVDVNIRDNYGNTALLNAVIGNHEECVDMLLEAKVNVNLENNKGWTALMFAAWQGDIKVTKKLLLHNVNPFVMDSKGMDAKAWATMRNHTYIANMIENYELSFIKSQTEKKNEYILVEFHEESISILYKYNRIILKKSSIIAIEVDNNSTYGIVTIICNDTQRYIFPLSSMSMYLQRIKNIIPHIIIKRKYHYTKLGAIWLYNNIDNYGTFSNNNQYMKVHCKIDVLKCQFHIFHDSKKLHVYEFLEFRKLKKMDVDKFVIKFVGRAVLQFKCDNNHDVDIWLNSIRSRILFLQTE